MGPLVEVTARSRSIRELILKRADRRNALSIELIEQIGAALNVLEREARVVILRGDGPTFSSGLDLREAANDALAERSATALEGMFRLLRDTSLTTIAAVHGGAYAGGAGLMAACDIVVAAEQAQIGFPEARRGLLPALISIVLRPKVRDGDLRDLFLTGEPITAQRAQQIGLVQRVVPPAELMNEAYRVADAIVAGGPLAIRLTKKLLNQSDDGVAEALQSMHLESRRSTEAREGLAAFLEKRNPSWMQEDKTP